MSVSCWQHGLSGLHATALGSVLWGLQHRGRAEPRNLPLPALLVCGGHIPDFKDSVLQMQDFSNVYVHHKLQ